MCQYTYKIMLAFHFVFTFYLHIQAYNVSETYKQREIYLGKESKIRFRCDGFSIGLSVVDRLAGFSIIPGEMDTEQDTENNSRIVYLEIVEIKATIFSCLIMVPDEFRVAISAFFSLRAG